MDRIEDSELIRSPIRLATADTRWLRSMYTALPQIRYCHGCNDTTITRFQVFADQEG